LFRARPGYDAVQTDMRSAIEKGIAGPQVKPEKRLLFILEPPFGEEPGHFVIRLMSEPTGMRHVEFGAVHGEDRFHDTED
jgi:hypothetical protein